MTRFEDRRGHEAPRPRFRETAGPDVRNPAVPSPASLSAAGLLALQRSVGNAAVGTLLGSVNRLHPVQRCRETGNPGCGCAQQEQEPVHRSVTEVVAQRMCPDGGTSISPQGFLLSPHGLLPLQRPPDVAAAFGLQRRVACKQEAGGDLSVPGEPVLQAFSVQRAPDKSKPASQDEKKKPGPQDVVVIMFSGSQKTDAVAEAAVIAPGAQIIYAMSLKELVDKLKALKVPVKTLFLLGHSTADGDIVFETLGKQVFVGAETIAQSLEGVVQVENVDFGGCAAAVSYKEINKVRKALKAKKARGSTCGLVKQVAGPIKTPKGKAITDRRTFDLSNAENRKLFDAGLKKLRDAFGDARKKCIINDSEDGYFQAHGKLIAVWANPESMAGSEAFDKTKSICHGDLKLEKVDPSKNPVIDEDECKLVELE